MSDVLLRRAAVVFGSGRLGGNSKKLSTSFGRWSHQLSSDANGLRSMKIMTFNLRYAEAPDGEHSWEHRKGLVVDVIKRHQPAILGTQEAMPVQVEYLLTHLGPNYRWFGACRFGTGEEERVAVFYDTRKLAMENHGDFWLSETPLVPGRKSWDSSLPRITSWGKFLRKDLLTSDPNEAFYFFNTHLDHIGPEARIRGAVLILKKMEEIMGKDSNGTVAFLTGDFNSNRTEQPWKLLTGKEEFEGQRGNLLDLWQIAEKRANPVHKTRHDYKGCKVVDPQARGHIDFIFCRPKTRFFDDEIMGDHCTGVKVSQVEVIIDGNDDGKFLSDHFPVSAIVTF